MIPPITLSEEYARNWRPTLEGLTDADLLQWYHAVIPTLQEDCRVVECGVWRGRSLLFAAELLAALGRPQAQAIGCDPYRFPPRAGDMEACTVSYRDALAGLLAHSTEEELSLVRLHRCRSLELVRMIGWKSCDLVMLDDDHSWPAVAMNIDHWRERVRPGGFLSGHDFSDLFPGVQQAVYSRFRGRFELRGTVWVWQRPEE